jgi:hypothetical protein
MLEWLSVHDFAVEIGESLGAVRWARAHACHHTCTTSLPIRPIRGAGALPQFAPARFLGQEVQDE